MCDHVQNLQTIQNMDTQKFTEKLSKLHGEVVLIDSQVQEIVSFLLRFQEAVQDCEEWHPRFYVLKIHGAYLLEIISN